MLVPMAELARQIQEVVNRRTVMYRTPQGHEYQVHDLVISPDGRVVDVQVISPDTGYQSTLWGMSRPDLGQLARHAGVRP